MIEFKKAEEKDVLNLARIKKTCWEQTYLNIYDKHEIEDFDFDYHSKRFLRQISDANENLYLILFKGRLVGYFNYGKAHYNNIEKYKTVMCINSLNILADYQRKGIGTKALNFMLKNLKENHKLVYVCCNTFNLKAKSFLTKNGAFLTDEIKSENKSLCQLYFEFDLED